MTIEYAIQILKILKYCEQTIDDCENEKSQAKIDAINLAISALQKQVKMKITRDVNAFECSSCKNRWNMSYSAFCPVCGQAIDWSDES